MSSKITVIKQNKTQHLPGILVAFLVISLLVTLVMEPVWLMDMVTAKSDERAVHKQSEIFKERLLSQEDSAQYSLTPSTLALDEEREFTTQAELFNRYVALSNNVVNKQAIYEVSFTTQSSGTIHRIDIVFPAGTVVDGRLLIERVGIGPGSLTASGNILTYIVNNPVPVPEGTHIRLEIGNIRNPSTPDVPLSVSITTRGPLNSIIDGPTNTNVYFIKQIGSADLANGAVTSEKVSSSFMVSRILSDGQNGWDPDGVILPKNFAVGDSAVKASNSHIYVSVDEPADGGPLPLVNVICMVEGIIDGAFQVVCNAPPAETSKLRYTVINQP